MYGIARQHWSVYLTAIFFSIALSVWASVGNEVINPDAICYLQSAQSMPQGLRFASQLCDQAKWPFYSALIFSFARVTHFSYLHSAEMLDGIFSLISVVTFISIVRRLNGSIRTMWFAALTILLAHEFNSIREYIVRDHGFFAFYLVSVFLLLRFFEKTNLTNALSWSASLIVATLFRIEGLIFLCLLPFVALLQGSTFSQRIKSFLKLNVLSLIGLAIFVMWVVMHPKQSLDHVGRVEEIRFQLAHGYSVAADNFMTKTHVIAQQVMSQYSKHDAAIVFFFAIIGLYLWNVLQNISLIYAALTVYAWSRKLLRVEKPVRWVLWSYIAVNIAITAIFLVENMFLSKRYLIALSLMFMLWVPFALEDLYRQWQQRKWPFVIAMLLIMIWSVGGIFNLGYSKNYLRLAGEWLQTNVTQQETIYSNDYQVMYYSQHFGNDIFAKAHEYSDEHAMSEQNLKQFNYVVLRMNRNDNMTVITKDFGEPVRTFKNKRGDEVAIYKVHQ